MSQHYGLDKLVENKVKEIPDTKVINPEYRRVEGLIKKEVGLLNRRRAKFASSSLEEDIEPRHVEKYEKVKSELQEEIRSIEKKVEELKAQRKNIQKHLKISELPEEEPFKRLREDSKHLIDTIKMIAYRAETAMASILREVMSRENDSRSLLVGIYKGDVDLIPDMEEQTLTVKLHHLENQSSSKAIQHLCNELNDTHTIFPGTNLRMIYQLVSPP